MNKNGDSNSIRHTIAVGKGDGRVKEIVLSEELTEQSGKESFPGPWKVRAVVQGNGVEPCDVDSSEIEQQEFKPDGATS